MTRVKCRCFEILPYICKHKHPSILHPSSAKDCAPRKKTDREREREREMGWKWVDDEEPSKIVSSGRGFGDVGEVVNPNPRSREEDHCSTRRVVRSRCRTEEVEPGRFIKKCERTQETLRDCIGR